jgi:hypothetical protein
MRRSAIALLAALTGMSITFPVFGQTQERYGPVLPNHWEQQIEIWGSWYVCDPRQLVGDHCAQTSFPAMRTQRTRDEYDRNVGTN